MAPRDPEEQRAASRDMWERAASGWGKRADQVRDWGMPVSAAMIEGLALQPGQHVVELAAGPGDTGFMAAELIQPAGTLISSDGSEAMLDVARKRAEQAGIIGVEFKLLDLEWIDLPTATVDAVLCRWGIMLIVDPDAAAREIRRIIKAGGRAAFAVWNGPASNPWATIPGLAMIELGGAEPPDPNAPGMFALAGDGRLADLLEGSGFTEVRIEPVAIQRGYDRVEQYLQETLDMSPTFGASFRELDESTQAAVLERIETGVKAFAGDDGKVILPGSSLVAIASA